MNYYNPNFYQNYPYQPNNQYSNPYAPQPQIPSMPTPSQISGKMVDGEDMVKVTEVPIGGYGVFPKADFSEIYIKTWNPNGTTNIVTFRPCAASPQENNEPDITINTLLEQLNKLESKLDAALSQNETKVQKKKEMHINDY